MTDQPTDLEGLRKQVHEQFGELDIIAVAEGMGFQRAEANGNPNLHNIVSPVHNYAAATIHMFLGIAMQRGELLDFSTLAHRIALALEGLEVIK